MPTPLPPALARLEAVLGLPAGTLEGADKARAEEALSGAATLVLEEVPLSVAERWKVDAPDVAVLVVLKAARREWENPRGLETESLGDHAVGLSDASGVYLSPREVALVRRAGRRGRSGGFVGSVRTPSAYYDPPELP